MTFLSVQPYDKIYVLRVTYPLTHTELKEIGIDAAGKLYTENQTHTLEVVPFENKTTTIQIIKEDINSDNAITVISLKDAEEKAIDYILENIAGANQCNDIIINIHNHANLIALRTRRNVGNTVLIHPDNVCKLTINYGNTTIPLNDNFKVIENTYMPLDKIIVLYKGSELDSGMFFAGETTKYLWFLTNHQNSLGNCLDYFGVVDITD